jgi:hypothetical protein
MKKIKFVPRFAKCDPIIIQGDFEKVGDYYIGKNTAVLSCSNYSDLKTNNFYNDVKLSAARCEVMPI